MPWAGRYDVYLTPIIVMTSRSRGGAAFRGGGGTWSHYERDIRHLLGASQFVLVTTMLDFYGYPSDAPGHKCCEGRHLQPDCVDSRETAMAGKIGQQRFLPNVVLHEFETWVIAAADATGELLGDRQAAALLVDAVNGVGGEAELVDDDPTTSPSKRVINAMPSFTKAIDGIAAIQRAGLDAVRERCPRLDTWPKTARLTT